MKRFFLIGAFLLFASPVFAATRVQVKYGATVSTGTSLATGNFGSLVTLGDHITCIARLGIDGITGDSQAFTVTDTVGTLYRRVISLTTNAQDPHLFAWDGIITKAGTNSVTMSNVTSTAAYQWIYCVEHTASTTAPAWNLPVSGVGTGSDLTTSAMTTVEDVDYILCGASQNALATYTAGTGYTLIDGSITASAQTYGGIEEKFPNAPLTAHTPHMTSSVGSTTAFSMLCVAFRTATGAPAVKRYRMYNFGGSTTAGNGDDVIAAGDAPNTEQARLFSSDNGLTGWVENYIYAPSSYGNNYAIRNPAVIAPSAATGGYWLMAHSETSLLDPNGRFTEDCSHIGIFRSTDGITWTEFARPSTGLFTTWAGHFFIDPADTGTLHYFVGASAHDPFDSGGLQTYHATSTDFGATWSSWTAVTGTTLPPSAGIWNDAQIFKIGSTYYMLFVDNGVAMVIFSSSSIDTGYTVLRSGDWTGQQTAATDGTVMYQIGGVWTLYWDYPGQAYYSHQTAGDWTGGGSTIWSAKIALNDVNGEHARAMEVVDFTASGSGNRGLMMMGVGQ